MSSAGDRLKSVFDERIWLRITDVGTFASTRSIMWSLFRTVSTGSAGTGSGAGTGGAAAAAEAAAAWACFSCSACTAACAAAASAACAALWRFHQIAPPVPPPASNTTIAAIAIQTFAEPPFLFAAGIFGLYNWPESDSCFSACSAALTSCIDCQRSSGLLRRHRFTTCSICGGTSGEISLIGLASSRRIAESVETAFSPPNARAPVTISYSTRPNEKTSERVSIFLPIACSGDM